MLNRRQFLRSSFSGAVATSSELGRQPKAGRPRQTELRNAVEKISGDLCILL
jgi:hypothetical protein